MAFQVGSSYKTFLLHSASYVATLQATLYHFVDQRTGLTVFFMQNGDQDRGFNICVRTPAENDKGIPHILEHCVLGGSRKYPVKDPFFSLLESSPNTFMNASTYDDRTQYLASSQISKDFDNLFSIYLDAVFFPLLTKEVFAREGYRLELDQNDKAVHSGVVYNEMSSYYSDPDTVAYRSVMRAIYPDSSYRFDSGGVPREIPHLTHQEVVDYHQKYYHPSNACISFHGRLDMEKYLDWIYREVVEQFAPLELGIPDVKPQAPCPNLRPVTEHYQQPLNKETTESTLLLIGLVGPHITRPHDELDWQALSLLLLENDYSPLRKALNDSGLGTTTWVYSGIDTTLQARLLIGRHGLTDSDSERLYSLIRKVAAEVASQEVEQSKKEYILKRIEINSRAYLRPTQITTIINENWRYGMDPFLSFDIEKLSTALRERLDRPDYFAKMLDQLILSNPHFTFSYLTPDISFSDKLVSKIQEELSAIGLHLSEGDKQAIKELQTKLAKPDQQKMLPRITPSDIHTRFHRTPEKQHGNLLVHTTRTRGLAFVDVIVDLSGLPDSLVPFLPLYSDLIGRSGSSGRTAEETLQVIERELATHVTSDITIKTSSDNSKLNIFLITSGHSLVADLPHLINHHKSYLYELNLTEQLPIKLTLDDKYYTAEGEAITNGTLTGMIAALRHSSRQGELKHLLEGPAQVSQVNKLYQQFKQEPDLLLAKLREITEFIKTAPVTYSLSHENPEDLVGYFDNDVKNLTNRPLASLANWQRPSRLREAWVGHSRVSYVVQTFPTVPYDHPDQPALQVLSAIVSSTFLHPKLREQGGAYGARAVSLTSQSQLAFYTHSDPNIELSLRIFGEAIDYLCRGKFKTRDVKNAICLIIGAIDTPVSPQAQGLNKALNTLVGTSDDLQELQRSRVLHVKKADVMRVAKKYLRPSEPQTVVVTSKEILSRDKIEIPIQEIGKDS